MNLSKYVTLKEAIKSNTATRHGIDNSPTPEHLEVMKRTAALLFDPVREHLDEPLGVSSFYRSYDLNKAIKGSKTSQHCKGEAIDIDCDMFGYGTNKEVFQFIKDNLDFDQLIAEFIDDGQPAWIHVSQNDGGINRGEILIAARVDGEVRYLPYNEELYNSIYN